jgi:hypothetical protein
MKNSAVMRTETISFFGGGSEKEFAFNPVELINTK